MPTDTPDTPDTPLTGPIRSRVHIHKENGTDIYHDVSAFSVDTQKGTPLSPERITDILQTHGIQVQTKGANLYALSPYTRRDPDTGETRAEDQLVCVTGWSTHTLKVWLGY